jgi:tRNA (guanine10-N2)-dimethyltransferase
MESTAEPLQKSPSKTRLFFVLSGEHTSLPGAEIRAILDSAALEAGTVKETYRLLILDVAQQALAVISERSLMYDWCGVVLGECQAEEEEIGRLVSSLPLEDLTKHSTNFAVRSTRLGGVNKNLPRVDLERDVGALIKRHVPRLRVHLTNPDLTFACILFDDSFLIGISGFAKPSGLIAPRRPRKRPVFHPSTMPPKIARCMVNLARAKPGGTFSDPFSGVGGISIEAAVLGCDVVAMDADLRMLRGARRNLRYFGLDAVGFVHGDARRTPFHDLDAVATDPPYGRGSSTLGQKTTNLVKDFLGGASGSLKKGGHVCISSPIEIQIEDYAAEAGLKMRERHLAKVHRSLTRQFVVLQNP